MTNRIHTFVICAYKESKYLEECICSLIKQKDTSEIKIVTSTPNEYISRLSNKYNIPLYINRGERGITQDWEFAISKADTPLVTIAHQDDIYNDDYAKIIISAIQSSNKPLIAFTDYYEIKNGQKVFDDKLLRIKRVMLSVLRLPIARHIIWIRRMVLAFGNPICCPSVTYYLPNIEIPIFQHHFRSNEDWEAWEKISKNEGEYIYINRALMGHRIHAESETSLIIGEDFRSDEDYEMFKKFWPDFIAKLLVKKYKDSEKFNNV